MQSFGFVFASGTTRCHSQADPEMAQLMDKVEMGMRRFSRNLSPLSLSLSLSALFASPTPTLSLSACSQNFVLIVFLFSAYIYGLFAPLRRNST